MNSPIPAVYKSIIRSISDAIEEINAGTLYDERIAYHNFEERTPEKDLPQITLIGTDGFSFDENEGRWMIRFAMAVSSYQDINLHSEIELLGLLHDRFGEGQKVALLEMDRGDQVSELLVSAFKVMPMAQSEQRNYRTIGIELLRTGT